MKNIEIDFFSKNFIATFNEFCFKSKPTPAMECGSIIRRQQAINDYLNELRSTSELSISVVSKTGEHIFPAFFRRIDETSVNLLFAFPNSKITNDLSLMRACWCSLCNEAFDYFGVTEIRSDIFRKHKLKSYKAFIKRFANVAEYIENKDKDYDSIKITKELITRHHEEFKI